MKSGLILGKEVEREGKVGGMGRFSIYILLYYMILYKNMFYALLNKETLRSTFLKTDQAKHNEFNGSLIPSLFLIS